MSIQEQEPKSARIEIEGSDGMALKQLVPEDAQRYFDLIKYDRAHLSQSHSGVRDNTADKYKTVEDVRRSIKKPQNPDKLRFGIWINGDMVGSNNLTPSSDDTSSVESGSWIGKQYTGNHYAARARELLVDVAFGKLGFERIFSDIAVENEASRKSVEKSGFKYAGIVEKPDDEGVPRQYWRYELNRRDINRPAP